jgi:hypothetical protein
MKSRPRKIPQKFFCFCFLEFDFFGKTELKILDKNQGYFLKDLFDISISNSWKVELKTK